MWTAIEGNLIVIAACVPTLHPVYDKIYTKIKMWMGMVAPGTGRGFSEDEQPGPCRGFWSKKLNAILDSITSSVQSRCSDTGAEYTQDLSPGSKMRDLEDAAGITRPGHTFLKSLN